MAGPTVDQTAQRILKGKIALGTNPQAGYASKQMASFTSAARSEQAFVADLQTLLDVAATTPPGTWNEATTAAVLAKQKALGFPQDGIVGQQFLIAIAPKYADFYESRLNAYFEKHPDKVPDQLKTSGKFVRLNAGDSTKDSNFDVALEAFKKTTPGLENQVGLSKAVRKALLLIQVDGAADENSSKSVAAGGATQNASAGSAPTATKTSQVSTTKTADGQAKDFQDALAKSINAFKAATAQLSESLKQYPDALKALGEPIEAFVAAYNDKNLKASSAAVERFSTARSALDAILGAPANQTTGPIDVTKLAAFAAVLVGQENAGSSAVVVASLRKVPPDALRAGLRAFRDAGIAMGEIVDVVKKMSAAPSGNAAPEKGTDGGKSPAEKPPAAAATTTSGAVNPTDQAWMGVQTATAEVYKYLPGQANDPLRQAFSRSVTKVAQEAIKPKSTILADLRGDVDSLEKALASDDYATAGSALNSLTGIIAATPTDAGVLQRGLTAVLPSKRSNLFASLKTLLKSVEDYAKTTTESSAPE